MFFNLIARGDENMIFFKRANDSENVILFCTKTRRDDFNHFFFKAFFLPYRFFTICIFHHHTTLTLTRITKFRRKKINDSKQNCTKSLSLIFFHDRRIIILQSALSIFFTTFFSFSFQRPFLYFRRIFCTTNRLF